MHDGMPNGLCGYLRHLGHLSHLSYLGTISNLDTLNSYSLNTTPTDSYYRAFIIKMDPKDSGLSEGYFTDNLLNPLPTATPLLPTQGAYTRQIALNGHGSPPEGEPHIRQIDAQMGIT
jgi:hypothetical protein